MKTRVQLDLFNSRALRDYGTHTTLSHESGVWHTRAMPLLVQFARTRPEGFLAEEFRQWWVSEGLMLPHSDKVWGALFLAVARTGAIHRTGEYRQAQSAKSHAHYYAVWQHSYFRSSTGGVDKGANSN